MYLPIYKDMITVQIGWVQLYPHLNKDIFLKSRLLVWGIDLEGVKDLWHKILQRLSLWSPYVFQKKPGSLPLTAILRSKN